jgi:hypothetical protein
MGAFGLGRSCCNGGGACGDAELGVDVLEVLAHCGRGDGEPVGDLGVGAALGELVDDLLLARYEGGDLFVE